VSNELETVRCTVMRESDAAFLLRDADDETREAWFPKSQVSFKMRNMKTGKATAEIPLWLLEKKGWNS
jgi:hypothetical protein